MLASALERDREFQPDAGAAFDEHLRLGTRQTAQRRAGTANLAATFLAARIAVSG